MSRIIQFFKIKFPLIPAISWGFLILYLTLRPKTTQGVSLPPWLQGIPFDKLAHGIFWGIWFWLYDYFYLNRKKVNPMNQDEIAALKDNREHYVGIVFMIGTGALIELLQRQLNWGREAEWLDLLADTLGVVLVAVGLQKTPLKKSRVSE